MVGLGIPGALSAKVLQMAQDQVNKAEKAQSLSGTQDQILMKAFHR